MSQQASAHYLCISQVPRLHLSWHKGLNLSWYHILLMVQVVGKRCQINRGGLVEPIIIIFLDKLVYFFYFSYSLVLLYRYKKKQDNLKTFPNETKDNQTWTLHTYMHTFLLYRSRTLYIGFRASRLFQNQQQKIDELLWGGVRGSSTRLVLLFAH